jgi:PadR family transcriptional regulator, regulatory protein PadR
MPKLVMYKFLMYICNSKTDCGTERSRSAGCSNDEKMKNSQLYKGSLNTIIMKLLEENGKMYGYEITQKVKLITQGELNITEGALYPALHKLEAEGLLDVEIEKVDNRLRKYYKLTENGTKETLNRLSELEDFIRNMQSLVNPKLEF